MPFAAARVFKTNTCGSASGRKVPMTTILVLEPAAVRVVVSSRQQTADAAFDGTLQRALAMQLRESGSYHSSLRCVSKDAPLSPEWSREVCERRGGSAVLDGSRTKLGNQ
jgi:hypothetical protein